jgi:hypothetical protein
LEDITLPAPTLLSCQGNISQSYFILMKPTLYPPGGFSMGCSHRIVFPILGSCSLFLVDDAGLYTVWMWAVSPTFREYILPQFSGSMMAATYTSETSATLSTFTQWKDSQQN